MCFEEGKPKGITKKINEHLHVHDQATLFKLHMMGDFD